MLALGRSNKNLPAIQVFCTLVIEIVRGVPLTTLLFAAWLLVPLFIGVVSVDLLVRASVGFILFTAVYVAEDIRGGLQAVSRGQVEAARAIGLNPFQITLLVVLPQALRAAVPAIVGEFLTLFKDTSLVFIIGMTDILGSA
ncbi:MAG: ABC transporter permease subunit, partial [Synechococcaceae cyanobacterium SM2_3_60]|nr:ABC transporter permease subunit [Synechococcaceae cyanobacterium SM2_3_60]